MWELRVQTLKPDPLALNLSIISYSCCDRGEVTFFLCLSLNCNYSIYLIPAKCMPVNWLQSCLVLHDTKDGSLPGSFVFGILQARILECLAIFSSRGSSWPRNWTDVSCLSCVGRQIPFTTHPPGKSKVKIGQWKMYAVTKPVFPVIVVCMTASFFGKVLAGILVI